IEPVSSDVFPLERLQVLQFVFSAHGRRALVPDFPAESAIRVPVGLLPDKGAIRIHPHRRVFAANRRSAPHRLDYCLIERLARCISTWISQHISVSSTVREDVRERPLRSPHPGLSTAAILPTRTTIEY